MPDTIRHAVAFVALIAAVFGCGVLYVTVQWYLRRRFGSVVVFAVWLVLTFGLAYFWFRRWCGEGLTCDVGGVDYRWVYIPRFAFLMGTALGVCTVLVLRRAQRSAPPRRRDVLIGATSFLVSCVIASYVFVAINTVTCDRRVMRRANGAYITECEYRTEQ